MSQSKREEIAELAARIAELEADLAAETAEPWQARDYYTAYYAMTGAMLGFVGGLVSLLANVFGSVAWSRATEVSQHPLRLIQVFLTFPLGEKALQSDSGVVLAIGCTLYLATGMLYGMLFQLVLTRFAPDATLIRRVVWASGLSVLIWVINFYGILSWLQPSLLGGNWIMELVPAWVAALTHLLFGWTMALAYPLGLYIPYRTSVESR